MNAKSNLANTMKKVITKIPKSICVIDLSNDFRVNSLTNGKWIYGMADHLKDFINYNANDKSETKISNPGCYAPSILSPLIPLLKEKYIQTDDIIIDSKSGISGAGKKSVTENLFSEVNNEDWANSDDLNLSFNSRYLMDIASHIENEMIVINLKDPGSPVLIRDFSDKDTFHVVMPMKI